MSSAAKISQVLNSNLTKNKLEEAFRLGSTSPGLSDGLICSHEPFVHCIVRNFLEQEGLEELQRTIMELKFCDKNNDLYKFKQTKALEERKEPAIKQLKSALNTLKNHLSKIFNVELSDKIDMFAAKYSYTDTLLCHDDELESRRIAYIYYLVPEDWSVKDGGALDLFSTCSESGLPDTIVKSISPVKNSLIFFEVTDKSFHQVAEVLSQSKCRLSVSGWFHGPPYPRPVCTNSSECQMIFDPNDIEEEILYSYVNNEYINPLTQSEIQEKFEEDSEIQLADFISLEKYRSICEALKGESINWKKLGPANKRNVEVADEDSLPESVKQCLRLLTSDAMFLILSNITGLHLHPLAADSNSDDETESSEPEPKKPRSEGDNSNESPCGQVSYQVRRWSHGAYTLLHDTDVEQGKDFALDAVMYFNCEEWDASQGGFTSYIAKGDDEELLTLEPRENCLSLVYRDADSLRFVKHVNHKITNTAHPYFYDICLIYTERSPEND
ncbi:OGFOD1 [Bugula neritina]|uniref:uS12 prolyl 3-hydroxylase n=1 Tax=Bugula neritina TaxID=10212 RepID=A0A7J7JV37_BUGNE|nr:OGFOD1 [Bugula neritina]